MRRVRRGRPAERGTTILELMFLVSLLALAAYVFARFMLGTRQAIGREDAAVHLLQSSVREVSNLRAGLAPCIELFANYSDATGDAMLPLRNLVHASVVASAALPVAGEGAPAPVAFSLWPTVETAYNYEPDMTGPTADAVEWGDELAYVVQLNPITFTAYYGYVGSSWIYSPTATTATTESAETLTVQRYQFVYDYLSLNTGTVVNGVGHGLRLTEWRSQPVVAYASLNSLTDSPGTYTGSTCCPRLTAACTYLSAAGYTVAFDPLDVTMTGTCSNCFYPLVPADVVNGTAESAPASLSMSSWAYLDDFDILQSNASSAGVDYGRIARANGGMSGETAGQSAYSVAFNTGTLSSLSVVGLQGAGGMIAVPAFGVANQSSTLNNMPGGTGFPAGFELSVGGAIGSREIVVRLALMASNAGSTVAGVFQAVSQTAEVAFAPQFDF